MHPVLQEATEGEEPQGGLLATYSKAQAHGRRLCAALRTP